jgi:glutaredoxin 3
MPVDITMYTTDHCSFCTSAKALLASKKVTPIEIRVDDDDEERAKMEKLSGRRTVPQIFINGRSIGGFEDLKRLSESGELDKLLGREV